MTDDTVAAASGQEASALRTGTMIWPIADATSARYTAPTKYRGKALHCVVTGAPARLRKR
jgi:hypothetical protein